MTNVDIATIFGRVADLLEFNAENAFRVRAYRNAAHTIGSMVESLASINLASINEHSGRSLTDIDGIGADLAAKIQILLDTGRLPLLDELEKAVPSGVFAIMRVPGLGPKKVKLLVDQLGIDSLEGLEAACLAGQVQDLKGFGEKTQAAILAAIPFAKSPEHSRLLWNDADSTVQILLAWMQTCPQGLEPGPHWRSRRRVEGVSSMDSRSCRRGRSWPCLWGAWR